MNYLNKFQLYKKMTNTLKVTLAIVMFFMLLPNIAISQDKDKNQSYWIHEDKVKPGMTSEYEKISKEFVALCKKHNIQDVNWITAATNDGSYLSISPIDKMADLDKNSFAPLQEKIGKEAFSNIFKRYNKCYDEHGGYIVVLNNKLSYMPNGLAQTQEGMNYRRWHYLYVTPENKSKVKENLEAVKALYSKKGSKVHYRVYQNGFGSMGDYYMVAISSKNGEDYEKNSTENKTILGDAAKPIFDELFKYVSKYEMKVGSMKPELDYSSK